jgi:hypothetical protein
MKHEKRITLEDEEWTILRMVFEDYNMDGLSKSEQLETKVIFEKIDYQLRGGRCFHEYGKIIHYYLKTSATREQPAEYESEAECLVCGDTVDAQDIQEVIE